VGILVDIPKPKAWPPPKKGDEFASERVSELLEYGAKRDPIGDKVHTVFACIFMFCLPLATAPASISMAILFGYSVLRLPTTWRTLTPLVTSSVYWSILAWAIYSTISISWSSDKTMGWDHASSMWLMAMPIPVLLWPVLRKWKWFIAAGLAGVFLQNMFQLSEIVGSWFLDGNDWITGKVLSTNGYIGFDKHQGNGSLFVATAAIVWVGILLNNRKNKKCFRFAIVGISFAIFGIVVAKSRAVWVGFGIATAIFMILNITYGKLSCKKTLMLIVGLCVLVIASTSFTRSSVGKHLQDIKQSATSYFNDGEIKTRNQMRLHWAETLLYKTLDQPAVFHGMFGHGLGSTRTIDFSVEGQPVAKTAQHPHNAYIQNLYEGGFVGLGLFVFMLIKTASFKSLRKPSPMTIASFSCLVLWATAAFFEGGQNSGRVLALLFVIAAIGPISTVKRLSKC